MRHLICTVVVRTYDVTSPAFRRSFRTSRLHIQRSGHLGWIQLFHHPIMSVSSFSTYCLTWCSTLCSAGPMTSFRRFRWLNAVSRVLLIRFAPFLFYWPCYIPYSLSGQSLPFLWCIGYTPLYVNCSTQSTSVMSRRWLQVGFVVGISWLLMIRSSWFLYRCLCNVKILSFL
jgi:hypothetical protein